MYVSLYQLSVSCDSATSGSRKTGMFGCCFNKIKKFRTSSKFRFASVIRFILKCLANSNFKDTLIQN